MASSDTADLGFAQLPHYSTHALEFFLDMAARLPTLGVDPSFERFIAECLKHAVKFLLPDNGYLFADHDYKPSMFELQRLPFPICALEFRASQELHAKDSALIHAEKRIALSFDPRALAPELFAQFLQIIERKASDLPARSIAMTAIYEAQTTWGAGVGFALMDLDDEGPLKVKEARELMAQGQLGLLSEQALASGQLQGKPSPYGLPCTFFAIPQRARLVGQSMDDAYSALYIDVLDEVRATYEFLAAINCSNVGTAQIDAPAKLNQKRSRLGKVPFYDYKVLDLGNKDLYRPGPAGTTGVELRKHLRRGHPRRIGEGSKRRTVWVNSTTVNPWKRDDPPVAQVYQVKPPAADP